MSKSNNNINRVAIIGAMHGNEYTGVQLIQLFEQNPQLIQRSNFDTFTLLANRKAFEENRRYIDKDLNRCFNSKDLENLELSSYEDKRAKEIVKHLKLQDKSQTTLLLDVHSTTSCMGLTVILITLHPVLLQLASHLSAINPLVNVLYIQSHEEDSFLISRCDLALAIEVGPIPQGLLRADLFEQTKNLIYEILDYVQALNQGEIQLTSENFTLFEQIGYVHYPRNEHGEIKGMIHENLQCRDYEPLNPGEPVFFNFDGTTIAYEGESTVFPVFINEAAYYEKNVAFCLTHKQQITI